MRKCIPILFGAQLAPSGRPAEVDINEIIFRGDIASLFRRRSTAACSPPPGFEPRRGHLVAKTLAPQRCGEDNGAKSHRYIPRALSARLPFHRAHRIDKVRRVQHGRRRSRNSLLRRRSSRQSSSGRAAGGLCATRLVGHIKLARKRLIMSASPLGCRRLRP